MSVRRMIKIFSGLPLFGKYIFSSITPKCPKEVSVTQFFFFEKICALFLLTQGEAFNLTAVSWKAYKRFYMQL